MISPCPGIMEGAFLESALLFVDCHAQSLGSNGYQALAASGSATSLLLTGMLTLVIALFGYRMLLGETPGIRPVALTFIKIGIVLALATSWAAYRPLVYNVAFHGPAELVAAVGAPVGVPGASGGITARLGQVDSAFVALGQFGPGPFNTARAPEPPSIFGTTALGTSRLVFLTATIAAFASVRLLGGLLLALGPFFVLFLLFDGTRGLFEGWLRALIATAIGAVAVTLMLGLELALLEPWLATLIAQRQANLPIGGAAIELLVIAFVFALVLIAGLGMAARIVLTFQLSARWREAVEPYSASLQTATISSTSRDRSGSPAEQHSRAAAIAEAVTNIERRETARLVTGGSPSRAALPGIEAGSGPLSPLGQSHRRRAQTRVSASANRRDLAR
jgi:type IV secretion system protein VirB6